MTRSNRGKPSPFRYVLTPEGKTPQSVECSRRIQTLQGARQSAVAWAGDVGAKGTITVEEYLDLHTAQWRGWKSVAVAEVVNSAIVRWL